MRSLASSHVLQYVMSCIISCQSHVSVAHVAQMRATRSVDDVLGPLEAHPDRFTLNRLQTHGLSSLALAGGHITSAPSQRTVRGDAVKDRAPSAIVRQVCVAPL